MAYLSVNGFSDSMKYGKSQNVLILPFSTSSFRILLLTFLFTSKISLDSPLRQHTPNQLNQNLWE